MINNLLLDDKTKFNDTEPSVTVIGDSIPKGLFLQDMRIRRVEKGAVQTISEQLNIQIENFSVFGQTLRKCYEKGHFDRWIEDHRNTHDLLVISLGGNDCDYSWKEVAEHPLAPHSPNTPLPQFEQLLHRLILKLKSNRIHPIFTSLPPIDSKRYFENFISKQADGSKIMQFFRGDITNISRHQECYNAAIMKAALLNRCDFIDYRSQLLLHTDYLDFLSDDGIHPNQKGHEAIAQIVCDKYLSVIKKIKSV